MRHQDQVAAITGAGRGIGRAIALRLAAGGASIAVLDVDEEGAQGTVGLVEAAGGTAIAVPCDVRDRTQVEAAHQAVLTRFGAVDLLVNNAGLVTMESLSELTDEHWDLVLDVNLKGTWLVTQVFAPSLAAGSRPAVVNLSTVEASVVVSSRGFCQVHYNASKGGVKMLTKALAVELGRAGVRVNAVAPGPIATDFVSLEGVRSPEAWEFMRQRILLGRIGEPEDVAAAVSFLLSDEASFITGHELVVDGGWTTR